MNRLVHEAVSSTVPLSIVGFFETRSPALQLAGARNHAEPSEVLHFCDVWFRTGQQSILGSILGCLVPYRAAVDSGVHSAQITGYNESYTYRATEPKTRVVLKTPKLMHKHFQMHASFLSINFCCPQNTKCANTFSSCFFPFYQFICKRITFLLRIRARSLPLKIRKSWLMTFVASGLIPTTGFDTNMTTHTHTHTLTHTHTHTHTHARICETRQRNKQKIDVKGRLRDNTR